MGFEHPPGTADGLHSALTTLGGVGADLGSQHERATSGATHSLTTWTGPRAGEFRAATTGLAAQVQNAQRAVDAAVAHLEEYRQKLAQACTDIDALQDKASTARRNGAEDPHPDPSARTALAAAVSGWENDAQQIRDDVRRVARQTAHAVDAATALILPGAQSLSPASIAQRVHAMTDVASAEEAMAAGLLTSDQAWEGLDNAKGAAQAAQWKVWAADYGITFPQHLDKASAAKLDGQLRAILRENEGLPADRRAQALEAWAARHSESDLVNLAMLDPSVVGNLDGLPNNLRYLANKQNIADGLAVERDKLASWKPAPTESDNSYVDYLRLEDRISTLDKLLHDTPLNKDVKHGVPYQVLAFTPPTYDGFSTSDDGRLAVVTGDLDNADHVGVQVPGITNRIDNFSSLLGDATREQGQVPGSATVVWLGYDTPELADSVTEDDADRGGAALHDFLLGTRRARGSDLTVMAHSYGTLVTSKALQAFHGQQLPDRVVLFGSPGLGDDIHSTADLGLPEGYPIYALRAKGDPVAVLAPFGSDPLDLPGITSLATKATGMTEAEGHSAYTDSGTMTLQNIAGVLSGLTVAPNDEGRHLVAGRNPLDDGLAGRYNENLRALVDELQKQVPAEQTYEFASVLEADAQRILQTGFEPSDIPHLAETLREALHTSGLESSLTNAELADAINQSGLDDNLSDDAADHVQSWLNEQDGLDDVSVPGPFGLRVPVPDGLNEGLGVLSHPFVEYGTKGLSHLALSGLAQLPPASRLLDAGHYAFDAATGTMRFLDDTTDATVRVLDDAKDDAVDTVDGAIDTGRAVWDGATGWMHWADARLLG